MDGTSAATGDMKPVSLETLTRTMQEIDLLPKPDQWIVIDPQGQMFKGKVEDVTRVLLAEHPLLKLPPLFPLVRGALDV
jgi:hypothetical protein